MLLTDFLVNPVVSRQYVLVGDPLLQNYVAERLIRQWPRQPIRINLEQLGVGILAGDITGLVHCGEVTRQNLPDTSFPLIVWADKTTLPRDCMDPLILECDYPKDRKLRKTLVQAMLYGVDSWKSDRNIVRLILDHVVDSESLLRAVQIHGLLPISDRTVMVMEKLLPPTPPTVEHCILHRNIPGVIQALKGGQTPTTVLSRLHRILSRVYYWLEISDSKESEELLGVSKSEIGLWRSLPRVYTAKKVREALEEAAEGYKLSRAGDDRTWVPRLYNSLTQLGVSNKC